MRASFRISKLPTAIQMLACGLLLSGLADKNNTVKPVELKKSVPEVFVSELGRFQITPPSCYKFEDREGDKEAPIADWLVANPGVTCSQDQKALKWIDIDVINIPPRDLKNCEATGTDMSYIAADLSKLAGRPTCYQARLYSKKPGELNDVSYSVKTSCSKGEVRLAFGVTTEQSAIDEMRKTGNVLMPEIVKQVMDSFRCLESK